MSGTLTVHRRCGRPEKAPEKRLVALSVRVEAEQADELCRRALKRGQSVGGYFREALRRVLSGG